MLGLFELPYILGAEGSDIDAVLAFLYFLCFILSWFWM